MRRASRQLDGRSRAAWVARPRWPAALALVAVPLLAAPAHTAEPPSRVAWTTSRVVGTPEPPPPYRTVRAFPAVSFQRPLEMALAPGSARLFVMQHDGKVFSLPPAEDAVPELFVDLKEVHPRLKAAYGLAFSPEFEQDRRVYVSYINSDQDPEGTRVARLRVLPGEPPRVDVHSEELLLTFLSGGHNGGCLRFGPDGCLYISTGDGTGPFPPDGLNTGQDLSDLLSSVLRIDVTRRDAGRAYAIPADNPFVGRDGIRPEVWAYGLRNPWKMAFDDAGLLWIGDVGWELWEQLFRAGPGFNGGWSVVEGRQPVKPDDRRGPTPISPPLVDHPHTEARSITGGLFYRGARLAELRGQYVYGDYETGRIWGVRMAGDQVAEHRELAVAPLKIICFGEDAAGELYVVDYGGGLYRLEPQPVDPHAPPFPRRLSETGLFVDTPRQQPAAGVVPFEVNVPLWADGATAARWLAMPGTTPIQTKPREWVYPAGTVLAKTLYQSADPGRTELPRRPVETQLLHFDGHVWRGYAYAWNEAATDAELVPADGAVRHFDLADPSAPGGLRRRAWTYSGRGECIVCHNHFAGTALGFQPEQLAQRLRAAPPKAAKPRPTTTPAASGGSAEDTVDAATPAALAAPRDPLDALAGLGLFDRPPEAFAKDRVPLARPDDPSAPLEARARAYLHANCSHCHRFGGGGTATIDLDYQTAPEKWGLVGKRPALGDFGLAGAALVQPGRPFSSVLYYRLATTGPGHMPRAGTVSVDDAGRRLVRDWIASLETLETAPPAATFPESADLASATAALALADRVADGALPPEERARLIALGAAHGDPIVSGLFERFLPEDQRRARLGTSVRPAEILALSGDPDRGRQLFLAGKAANCRACHRVGPDGEALGPELTQIGRRLDRARLLESILEPSRTIDPAFVAYQLETDAGQVHLGLVVEQTERQVTLRDAQRKPFVVPRAEIVHLVPSPRSLMPELLYRDLTAQQLADLIEFLSRLK